ncbi:hypothetical protein RFI_07347 [Reticulomyxa filosa]|uniref:Uncharacterized protein n=1 Tax=Reticulomyxa filosa TaxID=46433 RepID=X6NV50_RETFI|nr:hypothetical protein RFI_07347 [Reticulomyxa filosa]|eukprot:ETO29773.1 hypothetical protein RFI_07347 [Reticulomyxa filosa]
MDHPTLTSRGIRLVRNLREMKNLGGLDTKADVSGKALFERVSKQTVAECPDLKDKIESIQVDYNDATEKWWTDFFDDKEELIQRYNDLVQYLRYIDEDVVVCVGHSLYFRGFFQRYLSGNDTSELSNVSASKDEKETKEDVDVAGDEEVDGEKLQPSQDKNELWEQLKKKKLMNAGVAMCEVEFHDKDSDPNNKYGLHQSGKDDLWRNMTITDVKLLFDTKLCK